MSYKVSRRNKKTNQNAMLTDTQRDLLQNGGKGRSTETQRQHHEQIKDRVYNTILDFKLLQENWPEEKIDEVFDDLIDDGDNIEDLADVFAFLYSAVGESGIFRHALTQGVRKVESEKSVYDFPHIIQVDFEVERSQRAGFSAIEKYSKGREGIASLTEEEARWLINVLYADDSLFDENVVHAGLRFQKFLDGEEPKELKEIKKENKKRVAEEIEQHREKMGEYYKYRNKE